MSLRTKAAPAAATAMTDAIAAEAAALLGTGRQTAPFSSRYPGFGLEDAYRVAAAARALRERGGEKAVGRKIGFTNKALWSEYNVYAPMWGFMYDGTVHELSRADGFPLAPFPEPRIEPEIVFGLARAPAPTMDETALLRCIEWIALGFEIVQSIFPGWKFAPVDTIAACGLHGALLIGPRHEASGGEDWAGMLAGIEIDLYRDGALIDRGRGADVLGSPLTALRHLVELLAADRVNPSLAAGEIVTTGSLTRAFPVAAGETWHTVVRSTPLEGARIRLA